MTGRRRLAAKPVSTGTPESPVEPGLLVGRTPFLRIIAEEGVPPGTVKAGIERLLPTSVGK